MTSFKTSHAWFFQIIIYHSSSLAIASCLQTEPGSLQKPCKPSQTHSSGHHTVTNGQKAAPYKKRDSIQFCNRLEFTNLSQLLRQNVMLSRVPLAHTTADIPRSWLGCWLSQLLPPAWHKATHPTSCPYCREHCRTSCQPSGIENSLNSHILSALLAYSNYINTILPHLRTASSFCHVYLPIP